MDLAEQVLFDLQEVICLYNEEALAYQLGVAVDADEDDGDYDDDYDGDFEGRGRGASWWEGDEDGY